MKTLDEVIKALDFCIHDGDAQNCLGCPYADIDGEPACYGKDREDAFYYLKEYEDLEKDLQRARDHHYKCADDLNKEREAIKNNPQLTWEELREMKGKPVWVIDDKTFGWAIFDGPSIEWMEDENGKEKETVCALFVHGMHSYIIGRKADIGKKWQAYRKELGQ